jgi:hypothetical protein
MTQNESIDYLAAIRTRGIGELDIKMGIEIIEASPQRLVGTMPVVGNRQPIGLLHGGANVVLAESLGSVGTQLHAGPDRRIVGVDIKQDKYPIMKGICIINNLSNYTQIAQAIFRLRKINMGHSVDLLYVDNSVRNNEHFFINLLSKISKDTEKDLIKLYANRDIRNKLIENKKKFIQEHQTINGREIPTKYRFKSGNISIDIPYLDKEDLLNGDFKII